MECILITERSGFFINAITMDGAQWNRGVWKYFGINKDNPSCIHPYDESRQLWFMSDFPHLIKCLRNTLMQLDEFPVYKNI